MESAQQGGGAAVTGWAARAVARLLSFYKVAISPGLPPACRFEPTCSAYARQVILAHGLLRGGALALRRLLRCQPFCRGGFDPPPAAARED